MSWRAQRSSAAASGPPPELVLTGVALLWGSTFIVTKGLVRSVPPLTYLTLRFGLASLVLAIFERRRFGLARRALVDAGLLGLLQGAGLIFQVLGQIFTTASKSAFITSLNTPLTPLVGYLLYRTRPSNTQLAAVVLASLGLGLLTRPPAGAHYNPGDLTTLGCSFIYAFAIVETARRAPRHETGVFVFVQTAVAAAVFAIACAVAHSPLAAHAPGILGRIVAMEALPLPRTPKVLGLILYLAVVCTVFTFSAQTWAMARMSATHAAVVFSLEPVFATVFALAIDGAVEWPGARGAIGAGVVLVAVIVSEVRRSTDARRSSPQSDGPRP